MSLARNKAPEPLQKPTESYEAEVLRRAWERLNVNNEHFMLAIVGEEGSGKSLTALEIAKTLDPQFDADQVIFEVNELLQRLRDEDYREGQAFVLDEAGVSLGSRTWQDRGQVKVNQALQLIRSHNLALIFTLPRLSELDSQSRGRLQAFYEIVEKVPNQYVSGKWKYMDPDRGDDSDTIYKKYPRVYRNGSRVRVERLKFAPPDYDFVDEYHELKDAHQKRVYDEALQQGEDADDSEEEELTPNDVADEILDNGHEKYVSEHPQNKTKYVDKDLIRGEYGLSRRKAKVAKKLVEREVGELA